MFGSNKSALDKFQNQSNNILGFFHKTIDNLKSVNDGISTEIAEKEYQINELLNDQKDLDVLRESNAAVIKKINLLVD